MNLIDQNGAIEAIRDLLYEPDSVQYIWSSDAIGAVEKQPIVKAVPLEPLCKFLAGYAAPPIKSPLALYGSLEEAWKAYLTKRMEEQNDK